MTQNYKTSRIKSVDAFRLIAITAVIIIHTSPFAFSVPDHRIYDFIAVSINQIPRFGVPFFFVISGYFWGQKVRKGFPPLQTAIHTSKRLLQLFFIWSLVYLIPYNDLVLFCFNGTFNELIEKFSKNLQQLSQSPVTSLMQGSKSHLWFFIALLFSLNICAYFIKQKRVKSLIFISILLYGIGLIGKSYSNCFFDFNIQFNTRNGTFFGLIFYVSGYLISKFESDKKWLIYGMFLFLFGVFLHFSEVYYLWKIEGVSPWGHDFVIGTYFMGTGSALIALSNFEFPYLNLMSELGRLTLGIYAIHYIFVDLLQPYKINLESPSYEVINVILVLSFSIISALAISKISINAVSLRS
nr:acyltransferase [uncultured Desulfobacter sp.]